MATGGRRAEQRWLSALPLPGLNGFLTSLADAGREVWRGRRQPGRGGAGAAVRLCHELLSTAGEASGMAIAREILDLYEAMGETEKQGFRAALVAELGVDAGEIDRAARRFASAPDPASLAALGRAVEPRRQALFRRLNTAPGGTAALVRMRADLLAALKQDPDLGFIENDLQHLLSSWFNRGFLELARIDWDSPAAVLDKLIQHESVHAVAGWDDLRRRLADDRRCFAFFHPALPRDPVIFVEVALVRGLAASVQPLLDPAAAPGDPATADTAIFYSINNCHAGLRGISFGDFLIKQVVAELQREWPALKRFATLSPIPGFGPWLAALRDPGAAAPLDAGTLAALEALDDPAWIDFDDRVDRLRPILLGLCARYLVPEKQDAAALDPVARFHLRNGARLERINWLADRSPKGLQESAGLMVNYLYDPATIVANHEAYVRDHKVVAGRAVRALL